MPDKGLPTPQRRYPVNKEKKSLFRRIAILLSAVGPGLFLIGYNIGTGSITTMASAGSRYGMGLFWALIGIMAIVTTMVNEWTTIVLGIPVSTVAVAVVIMIGSYILLWDGKYEHFEKFLIILVIIMGASFLGSMFLVVPQPAESDRKQTSKIQQRLFTRVSHL